MPNNIRLLTEGNPRPGYEAGYLPQWLQADGVTTVITGEANPLPTSQYVQNTSGLWVPWDGNVDVNNFPSKQNVSVADALPAGSNKIGEVDAQLTGRNVEEVILVSVAVTGTATMPTAIVDISKYKDYEIYAVNTHDQPINIWPLMASDTFGYQTLYYNGTSFDDVGTKSVAVPNGGQYASYLIDSAWEFLSEPQTKIKFGLSAAVAPTAGTITVYLRGVPN